jgi:hypothetical protein
MLASSIPYKFATPWGASATTGFITAPIPATAAGAAASQALGFPPVTAQPVASGGIPPNIADINGGLNYETLWSQWLQAGAPIGYDAAFSTAIGGYPNGAMLRVQSIPGAFWLSVADNNTSDPDTGGSGWVLVQPSYGFQQVFTTSGSITVPAYVHRVKLTVWAAGAGGGATAGAGTAGAGGGGGEWRQGYFVVPAGGALTITVGTPGAAGVSGGNGGTGGNSSVASGATTLLLCNGGTGGGGSSSGASNSPGAGGMGGTGGTDNAPGGPGGTGNTVNSPIIWSGVGGWSFGGSIGITGGSSSTVGGEPGVGVGCGGGGGLNGGNGGAGGGGKVVVEY